MGIRQRKPQLNSRINWTDPETEEVHQNVKVIEVDPKVIVRSKYGYPKEIKLKDIDRKPKVATVPVDPHEM